MTKSAIAPNQIERLERLDVSCIVDSNPEIPTLPLSLRPVHKSTKSMAGKAFTVSTHNDFLPVIEALSKTEAGDVLVIDGTGGELALAGELFAMEAKRRGLAGIVLYGACRDSAAIAQIDLPFYALSMNPRAGNIEKIEETGQSLKLNNTSVNHGDIICGDHDGIAVIPVSKLDKVIEKAEAVQKKENQIFERMQKGESLFDMLNLEEHSQSVRDGKESRLQFQLD